MSLPYNDVAASVYSLVRATKHASGAIARLEGFVSGARGLVIVFVLAVLAYGFRAVAWPLQTGRDLDEYLYAYVQLLHRDVLLPWSMLFRTPVTPVFAGLVLDLGGGMAAEPAMALLYAGSVTCWVAASRYFGLRAALAVVVTLLVYPGYTLMFHELSSEPVFAAAFALWALLVTRAAFSPSVARFAPVGLGVAVLALVRPGSAVLLAFGVMPLLLAGTARVRLLRAAAFTLAAIVPLAAWSVHNGARFDYWGLARGGNAVIPFYRAFITDHIVSPENGPESRRLASAMQEHLLTREPYRSYGVTLDELFREGSFRVHEDLYLLSDQAFGWSSHYAILRDAGIEGVRAHPGTYVRGVARTMRDELAKAQFRPVDAEAGDAESAPEPAPGDSELLPVPTEGEPIPAGQVVWTSRPDQSIRQVWTSPTKWHFEFDRPRERVRFHELQGEVDSLFANLPDRRGNAALALRLNQLSRWFPRPWMFIVAGVVGIAWRRPRGWPTLVSLALAALAVILLNALGLFADLHFMLPVAPAFVLLGLAGLLGARRQPIKTAAEPS